MLVKEKSILTAALLGYFCIFYFTLQRVLLFVPHQFELSRIDLAIPFDARWTIVYQSLYLFLPLPWLASSNDQLRRYARGFFIVTLISFAFFLVFPVEGPRPDIMTSDPMYRLLLAYDRNLNAFPSLHAALAVYTFLFALRILPSKFAIAGSAWIALVLYATMATKQHYAIDVVAGVIVAIAADFLAWRYTPVDETHASRPPLVVRSGDNIRADTGGGGGASGAPQHQVDVRAGGE